MDPAAALTLADLESGAPGIWRYGAALPRIPAADRVTLGEAQTPLVPAELDGMRMLLKLEHLQPTGSYKDRGAALLISALRSFGARECLEDSSGNAASAMAAYGAAAGILCNVLAPAANSPAKLAQTRAHGARVTLVDGDREAVEREVQRLAEQSPDVRYVGHNWHPLFTAGVSTIGIELVEQLGGEPPDSVIMPVGYGNLLLGVAGGMEALRRSGQISRLPRLYAVQSESFPAIATAFAAGREGVAKLPGTKTVAEGIECVRPVRGRAVLAALRGSDGAAIMVPETEIAAATDTLVGHGHYVEPTSAVALAGLRRLLATGALDRGGRHVVVLTGSGQKTPALIERLLRDARS
ncbi:MAG: pyridoxal-phosphate dependent enzyme [Solirubrobacterales bacterium]